eukprot:6460277-Lingulodinium_polyedra.AAC.1
MKQCPTRRDPRKPAQHKRAGSAGRPATWMACSAAAPPPAGAHSATAVNVDAVSNHIGVGGNEG